MKAKYKERLRLILIDNKLSEEGKNKAMEKVIDDMDDEFAVVNAKLLQTINEYSIEKPLGI